MQTIKSNKTSSLGILPRVICVSFLSLHLAACGGGSSSGGSVTSNTDNTAVGLKANQIEVRFPFEMRNVDLQLVDFLTGKVVAQSNGFSGNSQIMSFPIEKPNQFYRLDIVTNANSQIYNPVIDSFNNPSTEIFAGSYRSFIFPTFEDRRSFVVSPVSNMIYERTLVRAGQLPGETIDPNLVKAVHLEFAANDVNAALINIFKDVNIPVMSRGSLSLANLDYNKSAQVYLDSYSSYGLFNYWFTQQSATQTFQKLTENLTEDLKDGYLDGRKLIGSTQPFSAVLTTVENTDPAQNNGVAISQNQKAARDTFANSLRQATVALGLNQKQDFLSPNGFKALQTYRYSGRIPLVNENLIRTSGAGDYRQALGFAGVTERCFGSAFPCKQGLTGINISTFNKNFPSIEYIVGRYVASDGCELKIRPEGQIELSKDGNRFSTTLNAQGSDNLLQVNSSNNSYLLNAGDDSTVANQYRFIQLNIVNNKVLSAVAGNDMQAAPSDLMIKNLQCQFTAI